MYMLYNLSAAVRMTAILVNILGAELRANNELGNEPDLKKGQLKKFPVGVEDITVITISVFPVSTFILS